MKLAPLVDELAVEIPPPAVAVAPPVLEEIDAPSSDIFDESQTDVNLPVPTAPDPAPAVVEAEATVVNFQEPASAA